MSAPTSRDPLVVNTQDGSCWTRRAVSRDGRGLYALAGAVVGCPNEVLATLAELAEHGLASMADALPVPVGDVPLRDERLAEIRNRRLDEVTAGPWLVADGADGKPVVYVELPAGGVRVLLSAGAASEADVQFVASARRSVPELLADGERLRARVAELEVGLPAMQEALFKALDRVTELEAERHSTNEALSDAAEALREQRDRIAELEQGPALPWAHAMSDDDLHGFLGDLVSAAMNRWRSHPEVPDRETLAAVEKACADWRTPGQGYRSDEPGESPDALKRTFAPVQALREESYESPLHHTYRLGRDLPEPGVPS